MVFLNFFYHFFFLLITVSFSLSLSTSTDGKSSGGEVAQVNTSLGQIIGTSLTVDGRTVSRFLGIPYAKPPIGPLRFARPQLLENDGKNTSFQAVHWPPICLQSSNRQLAGDGARFVTTKNMSEDCLYLNVWSPVELKLGSTLNSDQLKPVIVWIHGGGLIIGTSSFDLYDGEMLAAKADAVVVTFNYRLAILGNLYSDDVAAADVKGNQGFWDQNQALKWVQANIGAFGGRADQVTVMGESAGGWSVSAHILSPASRGLFSRAILQSGALVDFPGYAQAKDFVRLALTGIQAVGCASENDTSVSGEVVECLRQLPEEKITQVYGSIKKAPFESVVAVVDGVFIPEAPRKMLSSGNYQKNISLLVSTVEDEGSFIYSMFSKKSSNNDDQRANFSLAEAKAFFPGLLKAGLLKPVQLSGQVDLAALGETINKVVFNGLLAPPAIRRPGEWRKRLGVAFGDLAITCPTLNFAKEVFKGAPDSVRVYQWYFNSKLGNQKFFCQQPWAGACHTNDLYSVFGMPFRHPEQYVNREREISAEVINFIWAFIRTGTPGDRQPEWLPYFLVDNGKAVATPYYEITNDYKKPTNFKFNLKEFECSKVWAQFYRQ